MSSGVMVIDFEEWDTLAHVVSRLQPNETARTPGLALRAGDGRRCWSVHTPWMVVDIAGGEGTPTSAGTAWLPVGLVVAGAELARIEGECALRVAVQSATVGNGSGSAHFELPTAPEPPLRPHRPADLVGPSARVSTEQLGSLLGRARRLPPGVDLANTTGPDLWLGIEDGHVAATVAWNHFGASRMTARVPARTSGVTVARVPHLDLALLLEAVVSEAEVGITVDERQSVMWLDGDGWTAAVALTQIPSVGVEATGVAPAPVTTVAEALAAFDHRPAGEGAWTVEVDGSRFEVNEIDEGRTIRTSTCLVEGIEPTVWLWEEVNQLNAGMISTRVWVEGQRVMAARDLPRHDVGDLNVELWMLSRDCLGLGDLLAMLAAGEGSWG